MKNIDINRFSDAYSLRRLTKEDAGEIVGLMEDNSLYYAHSGGECSVEAVYRDLEALPPGKSIGEKYYLGYFERGYLIAVLDFIDGYPDADTAYIGFFMLDKCMQGRGLGTALMEKLCLYCGELGYKQVMLGWEKSNPQSSRFWRKLGFEPLREHEGIVVGRRVLSAPGAESGFGDFIMEQAKMHPAMAPRDALKMCYQAAHGAEHGISDRNAARKYLREELKRVKADSGEALFEQISPVLCRVNLRAWKAKGLPWQWLYSMFEKCRGGGETEPLFACVKHLAAEGAMPFTAEEWETELSRWDGNAVSHSEGYRTAEAPAYRIVPMKYTRCFEVLEKMAEYPDGCTVAIDGRSNSGKSTLGTMLAEVTGAGIVRMDDLLSPGGRMQVVNKGYPGGNVDYNLFQREILPNLGSSKAFSHSYYSNHSIVLSGRRRVRRSPWRIVEGSYSQHAVFGDYMDIRVFMTTDEATQRRRVLQRDGDRLAPSYFRIWIPQEEEYFNFFGLREKADVLIET